MASQLNCSRDGEVKALLEKLSALQPASLGHYYANGGLPSEIKALTPVSRCVGTAVTVYQPTPDSVPVHLVLERIEPGDILVVDRAGDNGVACVGEMVATAAKLKGAVGIIVNGVVTDLKELSELEIPIYARGTSVITTRALYEPGAKLNSDITVGDVTIKPGDILLGDVNGVLCIDPLDANVWKFAENALADEKKEMDWKHHLVSGRSLAELNGVDRNKFEERAGPSSWGAQ